MAEKRMFAKSIVLSDAFLDMPATARCLYFTLNMLADDDGFVNSPKSIMRQCMATEDDLKILFAKYYLIPFELGIVVIRHWRINNYLRCDRYSPTKFIDEKAQIFIDETGAYQKIDAPITELIEQKETKEIESVKEQKEEKKKTKKEKIIPLIDREPKNDIEKVEKAYLLNYKSLYEQKILRSPTPILNWNISRKLTKEAIEKYGTELIVEAVTKSIKSEFCVKKGYSLTIILSAGVLASLINVGRDPPKIDLSARYDMSDLVEGV